MERGGQVTIFILIAIVLIAIAGVYFVFKDNIFINSSNSEVASVSNFVQECIKDVGVGGLYFLAPTAGYFDIPSLSSENGLAYYYSNQKSYVPSKEMLAKELDKYIEFISPQCTNNFGNFTDFNITSGDVTSSTQINENDVILNVNYPISIKKNDSITTIENFKNIKLNYRYGEINSAVKEIVDSIGDEGICINCITSIAKKYGIKIDMTNTNYGVIFSITDSSSLGFDNHFEFKFIVNM